MSTTIGRVHLAELPRRDSPRKGTSKLEPLVRLAQELPCDEALRVEAKNRAEARHIADDVTRLLRDRGFGCRSRTALDAGAWCAYVWLDEDAQGVSPSRGRKT